MQCQYRHNISRINVGITWIQTFGFIINEIDFQKARVEVHLIWIAIDWDCEVDVDWREKVDTFHSSELAGKNGKYRMAFHSFHSADTIALAQMQEKIVWHRQGHWWHHRHAGTAPFFSDLLQDSFLRFLLRCF